MKLTNTRIIGRFHNAKTSQTVNIHKGRQVGRGVDVYFYLRSGQRVLVSAAERYSDWTFVKQ